MAGILPPQFQQDDNTCAMGDQFQELCKMIDESFENETIISLEIIAFEVHQTHFCATKEENIYHIGLSKQLIKNAVKLALQTEDEKALGLFFPDLNRIWRKKLENTSIDIDYELYLSSLALQIVPKCSEIWYFRRELLQRQTFGFKRWNSEFEMVFENAKAHKCNYYSWEHARWLIRYDEKFARKFNTKKFMAMMKISITDCSIFAFAIFMISKFEMLVSDFSKLTKDLLR